MQVNSDRYDHWNRLGVLCNPNSEMPPQLELRIQRMDAYLFQGLQAWQPQLNLLQTIPGMDVQGAAMLLVEIGADMGAFGSADRLASWVGMCPGNNESAGKRKSGRIRKGNAWVRRLLCEFAQAAARTRFALKARVRCAVHPQGPQEIHRRAGVQDAANHLRHAGQRSRLSGPER